MTCVGYNSNTLGFVFLDYLRGRAELWVIVILYFLCGGLMYVTLFCNACRMNFFCQKVLECMPVVLSWHVAVGLWVVCVRHILQHHALMLLQCEQLYTQFDVGHLFLHVGRIDWLAQNLEKILRHVLADHVGRHLFWLDAGLQHRWGIVSWLVFFPFFSRRWLVHWSCIYVCDTCAGSSFLGAFSRGICQWLHPTSFGPVRELCVNNVWFFRSNHSAVLHGV